MNTRPSTTSGRTAGADVSTIQERYDAAQAKLEAAAEAIRDGDKSVQYNLEVLTNERNRLAALLAAQTTERTTRTLLSFDPEE